MTTKKPAELATVDAAGNLADINKTQDMASTASAEIQGAIIMAIQFPRHEGNALSRVQQVCLRPQFREKAIYSYPRGGTEISGPSVVLAREFARCWGNIRYGFEVVAASDDRMQLRGYAWDLETNMRASQDASFKPLVYRKKGGWVKPDERDLRELVNKHGAVLERNCLLKVLPYDLVQESMVTIHQLTRKHIENDVEKERRKVVLAFAGLGIDASDLSELLGHDVMKDTTADDIVHLRGVFASIRDGNSRWADHLPQKGSSTVKAGDLLAGKGVSGEAAKPANHKAPGHDRAAKPEAPPEATPDEPEAGEPADDTPDIQTL